MSASVFIILPDGKIYVQGLGSTVSEFPYANLRETDGLIIIGHLVHLEPGQAVEVGNLLINDDWIRKLLVPPKLESNLNFAELLKIAGPPPRVVTPRNMSPDATYSDLEDYMNKGETAFLWVTGDEVTGLRFVEKKVHYGHAHTRGQESPFRLGYSADQGIFLRALKSYSRSKRVVLAVDGMCRNVSTTFQQSDFGKWVGFEGY